MHKIKNLFQAVEAAELKLLKSRDLAICRCRPVFTTSRRTITVPTTHTHGSTFEKENQLPHLPVPPLHETMDKYFKILQPYSTHLDLQHTSRVIKEFAKPNGVGELLQSELILRSKREENWLTPWWEQVAYYGYRDSVVINSSPGIVFPKQTFHSDTDQFRFVAKVIHAVLKFKKMVDEETLPIDYSRKEPQTMGQYRKLLSLSRLPQPVVDTLVHASPGSSRHVIVAHNNHFFCLEVYREGDEAVVLTEEELMQQLNHIVRCSRERNLTPVGVLTSDDRDMWALAYINLVKDYDNARNLEMIHNSICVVCLDQPVPGVPEGPVQKCGYRNKAGTIGINQVLHGGGSLENSMNRWFDKPCQFIVNRNGINGICYEHSGAEAPPVITLCDMVIEQATLLSHTTNDVEDVNPTLPEPQVLIWNLNEGAWEHMEHAINNIYKLTSNIDLQLFQFTNFGKNIPKMLKLSPDNFFQVCLQLAHWRAHGENVPTYESGSLRRFKHGRTECIRSSTTEAASFAKQMDSSGRDNHGKRQLFLEAVQAHVEYTLDAMNFKAVDRHLLGLKMIALEQGMDLPEVFRDQSYAYATQFKLSTSQVASRHEACLSYGPGTSDGYGVCYNPLEEQFIYMVSSYNSHQRTSSTDLGEAIAVSMRDVQLLFMGSSRL